MTPSDVFIDVGLVVGLCLCSFILGKYHERMRWRAKEKGHWNSLEDD